LSFLSLSQSLNQNYQRFCARHRKPLQVVLLFYSWQYLAPARVQNDFATETEPRRTPLLSKQILAAFPQTYLIS
jgi:hypothetical protein